MPTAWALRIDLGYYSTQKDGIPSYHMLTEIWLLTVSNDVAKQISLTAHLQKPLIFSFTLGVRSKVKKFWQKSLIHICFEISGLVLVGG